MATIEPVRKDLGHPHQTKKYSAPLRVWHWVNMIVISGSLLTVLINSTILDWGRAVPVVKDGLKESGLTVTDDQARSAVHSLGDSVWAIHIYFGYCLAALLVFRLALEFFQLADQRFIRKIKTAYHQFQTVKKERELARHELTVKIIYGFFYLLLLIMVVTGLTLTLEDVVFLKPFRHSVREVHGFCMYLIIGFIIVHLAGVFLAERKASRGIVSDMINGGNENS